MALVPASNRGTDPSANVDSVFGRTGVVVAASGDYTAAQVTNAADKSSAADQAFSGNITTTRATNTLAKIVATSSGSGQSLLDLVSDGGTGEVAMSSSGTLGLSFPGVASNVVAVVRGGAVVSTLTLQAGLATFIGRVVAAGAALNPIASGALTTVSPSSATAFQCSTTRDTDLVVPVTYNGAAADATCLVEISPDNVTFSTLGTETEKLGSVNGDVRLLTVHVPAGWRVKLTVANATIGTGTYY